MKRSHFLLPLIIFSLSCTKQKVKEKTSTNGFYKKAIKYFDANETDSALKYFNRAKDLFLAENDSLGVGKSFSKMAYIAQNKGDDFDCEEFGLNATKYFDKKNKDHHKYINANYNNLALSLHNSEEYDEAIKYYGEALRYSPSAFKSRTKNNIANAYQRKKEFSRAISIYEDALKADIGPIDFARTLSNLAFTKWLQQNNYNAEPDLRRALAIMEREKDIEVRNAGYSHLADYYASTNRDSAFYYAQKMYGVANVLHKSNDRLQALQKLIKLSKLGDTKRYFETYYQLDDSVEHVLHKAKNQFALVRYETEKKESDLLKAKAENAKKENDILRRNIVVGILGIGLVFGYLFYRKRKKGLQQEKELEVKNTALRYTRKIHDHVANKVYHIMSEVENVDEIDKNGLLDKLEIVYEISRDISYETKDAMDDHFAQKISTMLNSYSSGEVAIHLKGNDEQLWEHTNETAKAEVICILQELMTNMKKHSEASTVDLTFTKNEGFIHIAYADNGKGMGFKTPKNGLKNTETRIQNILGSITFDKAHEKGLKILLSFPSN